MEFNESELRVSLEATGKRYKWLRSRLMDSGKSSDERQSWEENITNLNSVIKKLLEYRHEKYPQAEQSDATDADSLLAGESTGGAEIGSKDFSSYQVLIADNDRGERRQIIRVLTDAGFIKFDEADDGHTAIGRIKEKPTPYDLVICDFNMPTLTGLDLLKLLRADEKYNAMPFIMVNDKGSKSCIQNAMAAGVNAYIVKPVNGENLLPKIALLINSN